MKKLWNKKEQEILKQNYLKYDQNELCLLLPNKTPEQIRNKKMYMGLKKGQKWSEEEKLTLLEHGGSNSNRQMADKFLPNKTRAQISSYRGGLIVNYAYDHLQRN